MADSPIPIDSHGFALHKSGFRDTLSLRYDWAFKKICHLIAVAAISSALSMLCHVQQEAFPPFNAMRSGILQLPYCQRCAMGSQWSHTYSLSLKRACPVVLPTPRIMQDLMSLCMAFGGRFERAFVDVRVFNRRARSNRQTSLQATYQCHEPEKKRQYEQRVRAVEHSSFTPLVLSTTGGTGRAQQLFTNDWLQ